MIVIEGNIGAGKTTAQRLITSTHKSCVSYLEPVQDNPYLSMFYENPKQYALEMQYYLMSRRYSMHRDAVEQEWYKGKNTIHDRSIFGDEAFAIVLHQDGFISDIGFHNYQMHRECMEKTILIPQLVIFLQVPPSVCYDRIRNRGRPCELGITVDYLTKLHDAYTQVIIPKLEKKTKVVVWPWEQGNDEKLSKEQLELVQSYIITHVGV